MTLEEIHNITDSINNPKYEKSDLLVLQKYFPFLNEITLKMNTSKDYVAPLGWLMKNHLLEFDCSDRDALNMILRGFKEALRLRKLIINDKR